MLRYNYQKTMATQLPTLLRGIAALAFSLLLASPLMASDQYKETVIQTVHQPTEESATSEETSQRLLPTLWEAANFHQASSSAAAPAPALQRRSNILGVLSLSFGIGSFLFLFLPFLGYLSLPFALAAIITGAIGIARDDRAGMSVAGLILGILVILLFILAVIVIASFL